MKNTDPKKKTCVSLADVLEPRGDETTGIDVDGRVSLTRNEKEMNFPRTGRKGKEDPVRERVERGGLSAGF